MRSRRARALVLAVLAAAAGLSGMPAAKAATSYEVHYVPSVDGALIRVEINRDTKFDADKQPVILTYSPYNSLGEPQPADDAVAGTYVSKGYARAVADVLGTRGSTGCWDYGGLKEQQSGVDVVKYLAKLPWSNGRVGMTGTSYEGTTANMVAARGDEVPELKGIIPIAAISHWYGYAFYDGVRYFGNSKVPTDEGFDTPLGFDVGFSDTVALDPQGEHFVDNVKARAAECGAVEHTQQGYSRTPDYGPFWLERDYRKDAAKFRAATMVVHGWQDYNVKQDEGVSLYEAIPVDDPATTDTVEGVPFKKLWLTQSSHAGGSGTGYQQAVDAFWAKTLKGSPVNTGQPVMTLGRTSAGASAYRAEAAWPIPGTNELALHLGRSVDAISGVPAATTGENGTLELAPQNDGDGWTHADPGGVSEEVTLADPTNRGTSQNGQPIRSHGFAWLYHESAPLTSNLRIAGRPVLDAWVNATTPGQHLTPVLAEVLPDGKLSFVARGFLNLSYRDGLAVAKPATGRMHAKVSFLPQDYTFTKGNRIALILQTSNTVWAVPGAAGTMSYANGPVANVTTIGSRLLLPVVGLDPAAPPLAG